MNKTLLLLTLAAGLLGGCAIYPAGYYGRRAYVAPAPAVVIIARPHYDWRY